MNKKRYLVEFDNNLKTYKSLNIPIPTVNIGSDDVEIEDTNYQYCQECNTDYIDGENCSCE